MVQANELFKILNLCNRAYRVSDNGVISYHYFPGYWSEINWKDFLAWRDKWQGFSEEELADIEFAEKYEVRPDFETERDFKAVEWAIDSGRCYAIYAIKHVTEEEAKKIHEYAQIVKEWSENPTAELDSAVECFWDDDENEDVASVFYDLFPNCGIPQVESMFEIKAGDEYHVQIEDE